MAGGWTSGCSNLAVRSPRSQRQGGYAPTGYPPVCLWAGGFSREGRDGWPRGLAPRCCGPATFSLQPRSGPAPSLRPVPSLGPCSQALKAFSPYPTRVFVLPPPSPHMLSTLQSGL